jgi:hypothetical protein
MRNMLPYKLRHYKGPAEKFHPYFMKITDAFPRRRWEDNIKMDLQEVGGGWMQLAQDMDRWWALVSTVKNLRVP